MNSDFRAGQSFSALNAIPSRSAADTSDWIDAGDRESVSIQIRWDGTLTAGVVTFESTEDPSLPDVCAIPLRDQSSANAVYVASCSCASNTSRYFAGNIPQRYFRVRISTAVAGGTVRCITHLHNASLEPVNGMPSADAASRRIYAQLTDGTSSASVKAASTAATANDLGVVVQPSPNRYAQATPFNLNSAASTNATSLKSSAGSITTLMVSNLSASARYLKLFNKASAPVPGTDTPFMTIPLPANTFQNLPLSDMGIRFSTGIAYAITASAALNDASSIGANEVQILGSYV